MAYVECKIWPFSDDIRHQEARYKVIKGRHKHYTVKALIDTSSSVNFISKSLADRLDSKDCLDLSFRYKGKDRLVSGSDEVFNDFVV